MLAHVAGNYEHANMSEKKRTTVTTIETHEVWIIKRPGSDLREEPATITPLAQPLAPSPASAGRDISLNEVEEEAE